MSLTKKIKERISIIIPTYNGLKLLKENLPHLMNAVYFAGSPHEIIVVDDGGQDETIPYIKEKFPQIITIRLPKNYGFARACNIASRESKNLILLFLNNDIRVTKDFLKPLLEPFKEEDAFAVSPKIIAERDKFIESIHETIFVSGYFCNKRVDFRFIEGINSLFPISFATGAALAVDKEKFLQLGGFDEIYHPFYWEDVDLSYRAWKHGWRVLYQPESVVFHARGATIGDGSKNPEIDKVFLRNMIIFTWKNLTDYKILFKHLILLPFDLIFAVIGRRRNYLAAFKEAFGKRKEIIARRKKQNKKLVYSDSEILNFFAESMDVLKNKTVLDYKKYEEKKEEPPVKAEKEEELKNVLVMHTHGGIGDLLLSTPVFSTLKKNYPNCKITLMVDDDREDVVQGNIYIDEIIPLRSDKIGNLVYLAQVLKLIKEKRFDTSIVLWSTFWEAYLTYLAGIKRRVGQANRILYSFLYNYPVKILSEEGDKTSHWVEIVLDYARALNLRALDRNLYFHVPQEAREAAKVLFEDLQISKNTLVIGLHAGKGLYLDSSMWPTDKFASIADKLVEKFKAVIVLTGGPDEVELVEDIEKKMKYRAVNLAGKVNLGQLGAVMERCDLFVCPDSGPMHIAAALGVPVVAIFALRSDFPNRWHPFRTKYEIVRNFYINCEQKCVKEKCKRFICMEQIREDDVVSAAERLLKGEKFFYH